ncbi:MAG: leucine--tRNA ligase [Flavobacteriales bacterium]|nr:leucine--tRNA ligase [Flavobacteriales bacterium]
MQYNFIEIEKKWQEFWAKDKTFQVFEDKNKEKFYVLDMFPYPSGSGLHVGHPLGYIASDIYARYKKHKGFNVLHPMGYDSFGLPTEQYAIETGIHPKTATEKNSNRYREQLDKLGFSFDWSREIKTSNPDYYKWTQWIFKQLFNSYYCNLEDKALPITKLIKEFERNGNSAVNVKSSDNTASFSSLEWLDFSHETKQEILLSYRLAYLSESMVNWCPELGTVLANDEVKEGRSERGGFLVEQKKMKQWSLRITAYADRLNEDLNQLDWSDSLKEMQRNWIGKSKGVTMGFSTENNELIEVFTTRPDTLYGVSFIVLSPEHKLVDSLVSKEQEKDVATYLSISKLKSERERQSEKKISGVFTGSYANHPFTKSKVEIWIADYVLASYGTGAVMAVPCGDQRDWLFAKHYNIEILNIFKETDISKAAYEGKDAVICNSGFLDGLNCLEAIDLSISKIVKLGIGEEKTNYRLRDSVFSRQRYWGEPFPVYYKNNIPYLVKCDDAVTLPEIDKYLPTETGDPPLARAKKTDWNIFEGDRMDTNIMPGWAGSSWYFLRFMDANNQNEFVSRKKSDYWGQVDLYIGGAEHAVGHLLYSRFWTKFLFDRQFISFEEPFKKLINQGMILGRSNFVYRIKGSNTFVTKSQKSNYDTSRMHVDIDLVENDYLDIKRFKKWRNEFSDAKFILEEDGRYQCSFEVEKMSKSKYNTQTPDVLVEKYGADTLRLYEMFLGPLEQFKPWDVNGISGVHNFLRKMWRHLHNDENQISLNSDLPSEASLKTLHKTIKKVDEDIQRFSFNTVVSTMMICLNELIDQKCKNKEIFSDFIILLSPYAPHFAEEIWQKMDNTSSLSTVKFPDYKLEYLIENEINYPVSFNGKMRFKVSLPASMSIKDIEVYILKHEKTIHYLSSAEPKRIIIVPKKIINIVI